MEDYSYAIGSIRDYFTIPHPKISKSSCLFSYALCFTCKTQLRILLITCRTGGLHIQAGATGTQCGRRRVGVGRRVGTRRVRSAGCLAQQLLAHLSYLQLQILLARKDIDVLGLVIKFNIIAFISRLKLRWTTHLKGYGGLGSGEVTVLGKQLHDQVAARLQHLAVPLLAGIRPSALQRCLWRPGRATRLVRALQFCKAFVFIRYLKIKVKV